MLCTSCHRVHTQHGNSSWTQKITTRKQKSNGFFVRTDGNDRMTTTTTIVSIAIFANNNLHNENRYVVQRPEKER